MEEKAILLQAVVPIGERRSMMNAWFKIQPTSLKISGPFHTRPQPFCVGISSTFVDSVLYTIGGRVPNHFVLSDCISWVSIAAPFPVWKTSKLPSPCVDSVLGVYGKYLYILPGVWKYGYYDIDKDKKGYIWDTHENKCLETRIGPPKVEGEKWQWRRIHACAPLHGEGLLIAMDGEKNNFFLYNPENNDWKAYNFKDPLPKFIGRTSFAASNGRLYILEVPDKSPAFLYIYNINKGEGRLVMDKIPILEFVDDLWSMDKWDGVVRLVPLTDDELCFLWLGPVSYENENGWPPVRSLHYLKFKVSYCSDQPINFVDNKVFSTNITDLLDCLPCIFETKGLIHTASVTAMAARENTVLFQVVVQSGESDLMMNAWFKLQPTHQVCGPFHVRQPFRLGMSSTFVGSSLYTIGGKVPFSRLCKPGYISWLDTRTPFNGWDVGELPSPCVDPVVCVYGDSLYILTAPEGYIWNTRVNECLETRIPAPKVEGGRREWRRIRACVALDGQGLLIAMDGEKNNFFLYKPEKNDWEICKFEDPLPNFSGETSFAISNQRLYISEVQVKLHVMLYIYDIMEGKLVKDKMPISICFNNPLLVGEEYGITVYRIVPVANDELCFLRLLHIWSFSLVEDGGQNPFLDYCKIKFSFNHNPSNSEVEVGVESCADDSRYLHIPNVTNLLDCLPCDAFQKQREDNVSAEEIGTSLISGEPFQDKVKDIASPKEKRRGKGKGKRKRTLLVYPLLRHKRKISKYREYRLKEKNENKAIEQLKNDIAVLDLNLDVKTKEADEGKNILDKMQIWSGREWITAEPETEPSFEYFHSRGKNIPEITAADKERLDKGEAIKLAADRWLTKW